MDEIAEALKALQDLKPYDDEDGKGDLYEVHSDWDTEIVPAARRIALGVADAAFGLGSGEALYHQAVGLSDTRCRPNCIACRHAALRERLAAMTAAE